ncbi:hypothetical protein ABZX85_50075 [Streptomyces sp. NPDC004539]|uniref:hypothetical protein n=1 Tax=Streptomyces sp. NPDC004539 TaxID=3154280 RepID=UPI0033BC513B
MSGSPGQEAGAAPPAAGASVAPEPDVGEAVPVPTGESPEELRPSPAPSRVAPPRTGPTPTRGPDLSRPAPPPPTEAARSTRSTPTPRNTSAPRSSPRSAPQARRGTTIRIGTWSAGVVRGGQDEVDACRSAVQWAGPELGAEDGYEMRTAVVVGHDYCGFDRFATLAVGTDVEISTPRGTWTYRVYGHHLTPGRGAPAAGLYWGDLTLQSCVGPDTGFSYLMRV